MLPKRNKYLGLPLKSDWTEIFSWQFIVSFWGDLSIPQNPILSYVQGPDWSNQSVLASSTHAHYLSYTALWRPMRSLSRLRTVQLRPHPYWESMVLPTVCIIPNTETSPGPPESELADIEKLHFPDIKIYIQKA